jgi:hypothetical protein
MRRAFAGLAALAAAGCSVVGLGEKTPEPSHVVLSALGPDTEIRRYAPQVAAVASMANGENAAFGLLFDYISGANDGGTKIAMSAPVAVSQKGERIAMTAPVAVADGQMRFFLPPGATAETAPRPTDPRVRLEAVPERTIAVRRFSGLRTEGALARERAALMARLETSEWMTAGPVEGWFYDPPWTLPPFRRNEVAVPVAPR